MFPVWPPTVASNAVADTCVSGKVPYCAVEAVSCAPSKATVIAPNWYGSKYVPV